MDIGPGVLQFVRVELAYAQQSLFQALRWARQAYDEDHFLVYQLRKHCTILDGTLISAIEQTTYEKEEVLSATDEELREV